jgi:hypothetical protein
MLVRYSRLLKSVTQSKAKQDDEGFAASQGVVFCATCDMDDDEDYPDDTEGVEFDIMEDSEEMPELIRDEDDDDSICRRDRAASVSTTST